MTVSLSCNLADIPEAFLYPLVATFACPFGYKKGHAIDYFLTHLLCEYDDEENIGVE